MPEIIRIKEHEVALGEQKIIRLEIARLPSGMMIEMPIHVFRSKTDGPVLLLLGGLHGDEVNGIEIVRRLMADGLPQKISMGTVIAIPVMNIFGFLNFSRDVPDGKDVNRSFPGDAKGSLASRVAHHFSKTIIPVIDYGLDFHTGGAARTNYPQIRYAMEDKNSEILAKAFAAPYTLNSNLIPKSLRHYASKQGKPIVVYEGGESMRFDEFSITEAIEGTERVLQFLGMIPSTYKEKESIFCTSTTWVRAQRSGLFKPFVASGEPVQKDQPIGVINDPFGAYEIKVFSKTEGHIIGHNNTPVIHQGDALFHIGVVD
jgi:hypothetical protein